MSDTLTPERWRAAVIATVEDHLDWLDPADVERLIRRHGAPSVLRRRRLAARDASICELASSLSAPSGRVLAAMVWARLERPSGNALATRAADLCGYKLPSEGQIRSLLAGRRR
jgi:hypothetical protein